MIGLFPSSGSPPSETSQEALTTQKGLLNQEKLLNSQREGFNVADVSGQEAQVLEVLKNHGEYSELPERYDDGPELETGNFQGLRDAELVTLYGTLAGVQANTLAENLDVSGATVSNYRSKLVEQNYLRNLQPGRGPSEYLPGLETIDMIEEYIPEIELLEDQDPARPLNGDEELKWLIGGELYEQLSGLEDTEEIIEEDNLEDQEKAPEIDVSLNGYAETEVVKLLDLVKSGETGFGPITEELGSETAHSMAADLERQGLLEEDREEVSGLSLTGKGKVYLESRPDTEETPEETIRTTRSTSTRSSSSSSGTSRRKRRSSNGKADEGLLQLGNELLDGHEEEISQDERSGIESRDITDPEGREVEMEDNNAGYTGFT